MIIKPKKSRKRKIVESSDSSGDNHNSFRRFRNNDRDHVNSLDVDVEFDFNIR